ncbi:MAG: trehalose-6-phosphate synthase [Candidatus Sericytochromatia bacterium]|nr:trehalose-6-phosphate synthase [Candidatus Sericytochromatia bacterium]
MTPVTGQPWVAAHRLPPLPPAGGGGLATSLEGLWQDDQLAGWVGIQGEAGHDNRKQRVKLAEEILQGYRDTWCHDILWPLAHGWFRPDGPSDLNDNARKAFGNYRQANQELALALAEAIGKASRAPVVQIHDYQLMLAPALLRRLRPDARIIHFLHVPVPDPGAWRWLPPDIATSLRLGLLGADLLAVQTAEDVERMRILLGGKPTDPKDMICIGRRSVRIEPHPVPIDPFRLERRVRMSHGTGRNLELDQLWPDLGARILLVGRTDPSKNLGRSLDAIERLLVMEPSLLGRLSVLCLAPESRMSSPTYMNYRQMLQDKVETLNSRWRRQGRPLVTALWEDDRDRALLALEAYDALLVAPLADGMNLVAKEGALLNRRNGVLLASQHMGSWEQLSPDCLDIHPLDSDGMAKGLSRALAMPTDERRRRHEAMRCRMLREDPAAWLDAQLKALGPPHELRSPMSRVA